MEAEVQSGPAGSLWSSALANMDTPHHMVHSVAERVELRRIFREVWEDVVLKHVSRELFPLAAGADRLKTCDVL